MILETQKDGGAAYLDVDFHADGLRLAVPVADVEAEGVPGGRSLALAVLDVEDAVRGHVLHRERRVGGDDPGAASRASCGRSRGRTFRGSCFIINSIL